jgi:hypothetical protein
LLGEFESDRSKQYLLYIYFKGVVPATTKLTKSELDTILGVNALDFSTALKNAFIKNFTIVFAGDFKVQYDQLIDTIQKTYRKGKEEAELYYLIISSHLLGIILNNPPAQRNKRVSSKAQLDDLISKNKKLIFKSAYSENLGIEKYHKLLRKQYFNSTLNTSPFERFFIIESKLPQSIVLLKELILSIKTKWSKNRTKTIPDSDRFAPYIYFNGILPDELLKLKKDLYGEGYKIKDGIDFLGADFNVESIIERPTYHNQVFFKLVTEQSHLEEILSKLTRTREIYQFYQTKAIDVTGDVKHIKVEIQDLNEIINII